MICRRHFLLVATISLIARTTWAAPLEVRVEASQPGQTAEFHPGTVRQADGTTLSVDRQSLLLNGKPWTPVMGEFHYARTPANEWREELLKMKAGGVDIVATYVFWIHHEEIEGEWDWSSCRDLRKFVQLCDEVGLKTIVRCGPWCHGEVRNGGHPDWLLKKGWKLRSNDKNYLGKVEFLYGQIAKQIDGLLWKDGGPVIGIQLENEYRGPAEHLLKLKEIACQAGLDVPLYTRTGWPALSSPMRFGEILPLYGVYAEGFWDRELQAMPGRYWAGFHCSTLRTDANIANEVLGRDNVKDAPDVAQYPYLTCEIGAGMMSSYHRRIDAQPADAEAITLVKIGSGSVSPGYYMYHGGVNPEGKLSTLNESQANGEWNDLPVKSYDFQTALGEYNQIRSQYHLLRRLHLFMQDFGPTLASMPPAMPEQRPTGKDDVETLRWCVRSDGNAGFVFVNNYERGRELPAKKDVQFQVELPTGPLTFPDQPITVPSGSRFIWPFNLDLGHGVKLAWATAQPICTIDDGNIRTVFFAETKGVPAAFAFAHTNLASINMYGKIAHPPGQTLFYDVRPHASSFIHVQFNLATYAPAVRIVLLDEAESLALWKGNWQGKERAFLSSAGLVLDGDKLRLTSRASEDFSVGIYPAPSELLSAGEPALTNRYGMFTRFKPAVGTTTVAKKLTFELLKEAGPAREIPMGKNAKPVAAQPVDADFAQAAVWRLKLPAHLDLTSDPLLRFDYVGDVARVMLNGKLLTDDFYNGKPLEVGLRRHAPEILNGELMLLVLPLRKDAPIYLPESAKPNYAGKESIAALRGVELLTQPTIQFSARNQP